VAKYRHDLGMTAQQLAERCKDLGAPIHRTTITKIENGRTRFDVGELFILAAALDVPPLVLLYPDLPAGEVEIIPDRPGTSWDAYLWATGMAPSFLNPDTPSKGAQLVNAVRDRHQLMAELARLQVEKALAGDDTLRKSLESRQTEVSGQIGRLNALINDVGGVLNNA
jgi:transcriptional regulator with XRE-family HTH domain